MRNVHIRLHVPNLEASRAFYAAASGASSCCTPIPQVGLGPSAT